MAGCKCRDGTYSTRCCKSVSRSRKARSKKATSSRKKRLPEREGDPASVIIDRLRRRGQMYTLLSLTQGGLYSAALLLEHEAMVQATAARSAKAWGYGHPATKYSPVRHERVAHARVRARSARQMKTAQRLATAGRLTGRIATRGIPIVGTALLAYDVYTVVDWAFAKGKLPAGARDRS